MFILVEGIEVIETEWGSELHQRLVAEEHATLVAWRDSPEAREQAQRMREALQTVEASRTQSV